MTVKVVDKGWNAYIARSIGINDKFSKVGYPNGASPGTGKGTKPPKTMEEIIDIAVVHEFGTANIPMRAHVRSTFDEDKEALAKRVVVELTQILEGKSTPEVSLKRLGEWHASRIKRKIKEGDFTPLAPETIKRKKSDKPLIDTAQMLNSITHEEN